MISAAKSTSHKQLEEYICSLRDFVERLRIEYELSQKQSQLQPAATSNLAVKSRSKLSTSPAIQPQPTFNLALDPALAAKAFETIEKELDNAQAAEDSWETQKVWSHYYEAELLSFHLMGEADWKARAKSIFNEAEDALDASEKKTIRDLIGKAGEGGVWVVQDEEKLEKPKVIEARRITQVHYCDAYTKLGMSLKQLRILAAIAIAITAIIMVSLVIVPNTTAVVFNVGNTTESNATVSTNVTFNSTATNAAGDSIFANYTFTSFFFLGVALFGALGGTASGMITIAKSSKGAIPERLLNSWLTIAKPVFGAVAALAVSVFLLAGLLQSVEGLLKPSAAITTYAVFAISFASGFSERILLRAVGEDGKNEKS
jgi:hypothetical protein